jgi:hypothetical protein
VLFQSGRAPGELCSGFTNGKSTDEVLPAMYAAPVLSTAIAAPAALTLPPRAVS